jgi:DNA-binding response OmpR family regulator
VRVLIVEDEMTIAMMIEDMLEALGHEIAGVATRLGAALQVSETTDAQIAILDVNLDGRESFPVADVLRRRGIPFVFATGYGNHGVRDDFADAPILSKPFQVSELDDALSAAASRVGP